MTRFYLRALLLSTAIAGLACPASGQTPAAPVRPQAPAARPPDPDPQAGASEAAGAWRPTPGLIGTSIPAEALDDLPAAGNLLTLLDTVAADVITDRVDTGGLSVGAAARMGGHGSTWTQTGFELDGVGFTDPDGSGTPLMLPGVLEWDRVDVRTGAMPIDSNAVGLLVSLRPRRPGSVWTGRADLIGSESPLVAAPAVDFAPTISHLNSYRNGSFLVSGPLLPDRLGVVLAGSWIQSTRFDRTDPTELSSRLGSMFAHLVFTPTPRDEARLIAWVQRGQSPSDNRVALRQADASETDSSAHGQFIWDRRVLDGRTLSAYGSFSARQRSPDLAAPAATFMDRVFDGPVTALIYPGAGTDESWSAGARLRPASDHDTGVRGARLGLEVSGGSASLRPGFTGTVGEAVNGLPARVWKIAGSGLASRWNETTVAVYASDHLAPVPRLTVDVGGRFEAVNGSAESGSTPISWHDFLPRAGLRWSILDWKQIAFFANYGRTAFRLPLTALAWGDPTAASGAVYRWNTRSATHAPLASEIGALIRPIGPGGAPGVTAIDPALARPHMDEITFGFDGWANRSTLVRISAMARREQSLLGVADTGVPASAYAASLVPDPGADLASSSDDQLLPVYNRPASTFGRDRYVLTNPADNEGTFVGVDVSIQSHTDRLYYLLAGTAGRTEALAGNRGFLATENDEGVLGETFLDPNARTFAQGRTFTERGYTIKTAGTYRFDHDVRLGVTARYQDGQHFSRLVIAPSLNQGPEAIRAFRDGKTRFTYTMTVDARLQKAFTIDRYSVAAMLDVYNVFNQHTEIEEFPVSGALSRTTTAIQPPRAIHVGLRLAF
ncbi:MAG TPA: TonB-dependent receptor [Vicinamibacterales bacterium]|nr:TonB-dependent receptor [Vicinamibacterales bacterium]